MTKEEEAAKKREEAAKKKEEARIAKENKKPKLTTFKALYSPKQFFSFRGQKFRANRWLLTTDNASVITFLEKSTAWEKKA